MSASTTFKLTRNGTPVDPPTNIKEPTTLEERLKWSKIVRHKQGKVLTSTKPINAVSASFSNSFIGAIFDAYSDHYKLVLRPDDVWLTIVIAFADYIDYHAEEMRNLFVQHEGKQQLIVNTDNIGYSVENCYDLIAKFSNLINEYTVGSVRDWIEPNFTTTTEKDSLIGRVALMGAMKHYFSYLGSISCGIPEVTLMGTLDDWKQLKEKIERIAKYGMESNQEPLLWWHKILIPIVQQFISSYEGNIDHNFWQSCAVISGGSGVSYMSGWLLAFSPFNKGKWRLNHPENIQITKEYGIVDTDKFETSATIEVPLQIIHGNRLINACFYAGGIVNSYDPVYNVMSPSFDFVMFEIPEVTSNHSSLAKQDKVTTAINRQRTINVPQHPHTLVRFFNCEGKICNVCNNSIDLAAYYCIESTCDYICCFDCLDKSEHSH